MAHSIGLRSRDSIIGVMPRLRAQRSAVRIPARQGIFSLLSNVQTGPTQPPVRRLSGFFTKEKRRGSDVEYSTPSSAEIKN